MQRICKQCNQGFEIDERDLEFYKKIEVPPPTLCPEDRAQRRWGFRPKNFYLRACDNCGKKVMSWISPNSKKIKAYCEDCFKSDEFDAMVYGQDIDFNRSFFEQFQELFTKVPRHTSNAINNENSAYIICAHNNKNCYFVDEVDGSWDCYYGYNVQYCKNLVECLYVRDSEIGYDLIKAENCYSVFYSKNVFNCKNSAFLLNCRNCTNCLFCANLRNQEYCIFNKKVSPEEFKKFWDFAFAGKQENVDISKGKFEEFLKTQFYPASLIINSEDSEGDYLSNCKNVSDSFCVDNCRDCRYCSDIHYSKDCYDVNIYEGDLMYECLHVGPKGYGQFFTQLTWFSTNIYYCLDARSCRDCFGCVGTKRKEFCILNKQYSKDQYESLKAKLIEKIKEDKEWGEFLPLTMSQFAYNTTMAQRFFPLSKEEVLARGLEWEDEEEKTDFRITDAEKAFYEKYGIPLPTIAPMKRIEKLWSKMPVRKLREVKCGKCGIPTKTTLPEELKDRILCQECYVASLGSAA
ncbi:MAG: hypothetical protein AAB373_00630 [Patescibacteria group bacterium]